MLSNYITDKVGLPTLTDIMDALNKRGLDPREQAKVFSFDPNVHEIEDLRVGMVLPGLVSNIKAFGAFVNIGVHQDCLVHISQLADRFEASYFVVHARSLKFSKMAVSSLHRKSQFLQRKSFQLVGEF